MKRTASYTGSTHEEANPQLKMLMGMKPWKDIRDGTVRVPQEVENIEKGRRNVVLHEYTAQQIEEMAEVKDLEDAMNEIIDMEQELQFAAMSIDFHAYLMMAAQTSKGFTFQPEYNLRARLGKVL